LVVSGKHGVHVLTLFIRGLGIENLSFHCVTSLHAYETETLYIVFCETRRYFPIKLNRLRCRTKNGVC